MTLPTKVLDDINALVHPIREADEKAVAAAKVDFAKEKADISTEVRGVAAAAVAAVKANTPEVEAVAKAAAKAVEDAVEAALVARGL
jgi:hypothetical protein